MHNLNNYRGNFFPKDSILKFTETTNAGIFRKFKLTNLLKEKVKKTY